jgi:hypothetical protein
METSLLTANGKIRCTRCTARSARTGQQCGRPALKSSKAQKCQFHGGKSSGPKTPGGRARIAAAKTNHGKETRSSRAQRAAASARLSQYEDGARLLGMMSGPRLRGRKANGYTPIRTLEQLIRMIVEDSLHSDEGSSGESKKYYAQDP